jgi:flagellar basal-body rod modification protein FlgD
MVDISSVISTANSLTSSSSTSSDTTTVADSFDTFLTLLTTQLQNQDPTDPLDTNQFTQQLIQYTEVEQLIKSNENLESLVQLSSANTSASLVSYVGKTAVLDSTETSLYDGSATWYVDFPSDASEVTYVIENEDGEEVFSQTGSATAGENTITWDGTDTAGTQLSSGTYKLTVTATNTNGDTVAAEIAVGGTISGVDMTGDVPVLVINGTDYDIDDVDKIYQASSS